MIEPTPIAAAALAGAREEAKAYLRIESADEDALLDRLIASAVTLCEAFTGQILIERGFAESLPASAEWRRLNLRPVRSITGVAIRPSGGAAAALPAASYLIDIAADGRGLVRLTDGAASGILIVSYSAGLATAWSGIPEALRQGIVRLVAHGHAHRDAAGDEGPPAAVAALWRPWREMRL